MKPSKRDRLIDRVRKGDLTPEEAEAEAASQGLRPLARKPLPAAFNPIVEMSWSLPMTIAWIMWRSPEKVRDYWDAYRHECWDWIPQARPRDRHGARHRGSDLRQRGPATWAELASDAATDMSIVSIERAKGDLWAALTENRLQGGGIDVETGEPVAIAPTTWTSLEWRDQATTKGFGVRTGGKDGGYDAVWVGPHAVVALWEPREPIPAFLPEPMAPTGPGSMPLFCAVRWIATVGGTVTVLPSDTSIWENAFAQLLARIASNEVTVSGMRGGKRERLDGQVFADIAVEYPFGGASVTLTLSGELFLRSYEYLDDQQWRGGFDDSLCDRGGVQWSRLMVLRSEVTRFWPSDAEVHPRRTGAPGRPPQTIEVEKEFRERCDNGIAEKRLSREVEALRKWFIRKFPQKEPPSPKTIENNIRDAHRRYRENPRN